MISHRVKTKEKGEMRAERSLSVGGKKEELAPEGGKYIKRMPGEKSQLTK